MKKLLVGFLILASFNLVHANSCAENLLNNRLEASDMGTRFNLSFDTNKSSDMEEGIDSFDRETSEGKILIEYVEQEDSIYVFKFLNYEKDGEEYRYFTSYTFDKECNITRILSKFKDGNRGTTVVNVYKKRDCDFLNAVADSDILDLSESERLLAQHASKECKAVEDSGLKIKWSRYAGASRSNGGILRKAKRNTVIQE
jgi:hypothetical protein